MVRLLCSLLSSSLNGVFPVYKPSGITSSNVVNRLKNILSTEQLRRFNNRQWIKVGHGGTLDIEAEGVLVIGVGSGCKQLKQFIKCDKSYTATGTFGTTTDTLTATGMITDTQPYDHITRLSLESILESFKGEQYQIPPLYSALKFSGKRASDWAREGVEKDMTLKERLIVIHSINLIGHFELPEFHIEVSCSSGTYIRSLMRDIGKKLGTVAYMKHLCRTKQGPYDLDNALTEENWTYDSIQTACQQPIPTKRIVTSAK